MSDAPGEDVVYVELPADGLSTHLKVGVAAAGVAALGVLLHGMHEDAARLRAESAGQAPATVQAVAGAAPQSGSAAPAPGGAAEPPAAGAERGAAAAAAPATGADVDPGARAAGGQATAPSAGATSPGGAVASTGARRDSTGAPVQAAPPSAPRTQAPAPGRYAYAVQVDDQAPTASRVDVAALPTRPGTGVLRRSTETWAGSTTVTDTGWSASRARTIASGTGDARCTWAPAVDDLQLPLAAGRTWSTRTRCTGAALTRTETTTTTVRGYDRVLVGGRRVFVWVLERRSSASVSAPGAVATSNTASSELFAPSLGLPVLEVAQVRFVGEGGREQVARAVRRLESTQPH